MKLKKAEAFRALALGALLCLSACATPVPTPESVAPIANTESWASWWMPRHQEKLAEIKRRQADKRNTELVFIGDSITHFWENAGKQVWDRHYAQYNALDLGFSADRTEHVLWRLQHGEVDGIHPKVAVLMIGTNNTGGLREPKGTAAAIKVIIGELRQRLPGTKILVLAIFPRADMPGTPVNRINDEINAILPGLADNRHIFFLNINRALLSAGGTVSKDIMPDLLHPNEQGYEVWADAMEPELQRLMQQAK
jgi:lysophospholipase L1-like esterase